MEAHTSAPGKIILFGEHVSRHGKPSIVFAVNSRVHVFLSSRDDEKVILNSPELDIKDEEWPSDALEHVSVAIKNFFDKIGKKNGFNLNIESKMLEGLEISSATVIATIGALDVLYETDLTKKDIFDLALKTFMDIQGFDNAIDLAASNYGGILRFVKDEEPKVITTERLPILVANTGIKVKIDRIVETVEAKEKQYPGLLNPVIDSIGNISDMAIDLIQQNDLHGLGELMNINHGLLYTEGVSSLILEKMVWAARDSGAYGAKLSGAGFGDNMIAIIPEDKRYDIEKAIHDAGGKVLNLEIDPEGLKIEK